MKNKIDLFQRDIENPPTEGIFILSVFYGDKSYKTFSGSYSYCKNVLLKLLDSKNQMVEKKGEDSYRRIVTYANSSNDYLVIRETFSKCLEEVSKYVDCLGWRKLK